MDRLLTKTWQHEHPKLAECETCIAALEQSAQLYCADFLADFHLEESSLYDEWSNTVREPYRGKVLETLESLTNIALEKHAFEQAGEYAKRQLPIDNFQESAQHQLMGILTRSGRWTEALRQ